MLEGNQGSRASGSRSRLCQAIRYLRGNQELTPYVTPSLELREHRAARRRIRISEDVALAGPVALGLHLPPSSCAEPSLNERLQQGFDVSGIDEVQELGERGIHG